MGRGFDMVGDAGSSTAGTLKSHSILGIPITKNGYIYVYVSNESRYNVFFDNLQLFHNRGALLEETHYYPFGLTMAGISSKALNFGNVELKQKFVGQELDEELDVNWYQFRYRNHDPQIGRFIQIDPLASDYTHNSTYAYAENRVINGIDLEGREFDWFMWKFIIGLKIQAEGSINAAGKIGSGQSGKSYDDSPLPPPVKETFNKAEVLNDYYDLAQPALTIYKITETAYSLLPVGEGVGFSTKIALGASRRTPFTLKQAGKFFQNTIDDVPRLSISENAGSELSIYSKFGSATKEVAQTESKIFLVTKEGVVLPRGAKIPEEFIENAHRSSSYGVIQNGKFVEKVRIDPATPSGFKGPNQSHFHLNNGKHIFYDSKWPWW